MYNVNPWSSSLFATWCSERTSQIIFTLRIQYNFISVPCAAAATADVARSTASHSILFRFGGEIHNWMRQQRRQQQQWCDRFRFYQIKSLIIKRFLRRQLMMATNPFDTMIIINFSNGPVMTLCAFDECTFKKPHAKWSCRKCWSSIIETNKIQDIKSLPLILYTRLIEYKILAIYIANIVMQSLAK